MNKQIIISIFFLLSFGFISQSKGQTLSKGQTELIKNQVDSIFKKMVVFAEKLDYDKLSEGVNDKYNAGFITNGKYYSTFASLINDVKSRAQGIDKQSFMIKDKKITVLSDKIVLLTSSGISQIGLDNGNEINLTFHWSFIFEKIDGNWKVIYSHQSRAN